MSRLLTQLDPSLPARTPSPGSSGDDSAPATPSKDKMREWTFPRAVPSTSQQSPPARVHNHYLVDGAHGRSSSVTPGSAAKAARHGAESKDLRHRSNASLVHSPSAPLLPRLSPSAPKDVAKLVYSNVRRRSLNDVVYVVVFGGALFLFATALLGVGFDGAAGRPRSSAAAVRADRDAAGAPGQGAVVDVELPPGFLPHAQPAGDEYLADVHQPHGDSSHDAGADHFLASPDDPSLSDDHVHDHHPPSDPLWPEDPSHLDRDAEAIAQPRPRPARLAAQDVDEPGELDSETEEARLVELIGAHEGDVEEHEELDVVYEGDEEEEDTATSPEPLLIIDEGEPEEDDDDDSDAGEAADGVRSGELHVVDADDDESSSSLSALEELLDSAQEEEAAARAPGVGVDADEVQRGALTRAQRGREALARVQAKAAAPAPAVERRMVRARKARR